MHERDRRRTSSTVNRPAANRPAPSKPKEPDFTEHKSYKIFVSKKLSVILGSLFFLTGLFATLDYFGPKTTSHEVILGFPAGGNISLVRTAQSYFVIDMKLQYKTFDLHNIPVDVDKSMLTKTVLSFSLPKNYPGEKFYPLSTRYDYIWLFVLNIISGLVLIFYPKKNYSKIYLTVFAIIIFFSAIITVIACQATIDGIYAVRTMGW